MMPSLLILISAVFYGISPIIAKAVYGFGVTPLTLLGIRSSFAAACLWAGLIVTRTPFQPPRSSLVPLLVMGSTLVPVQVFAYFQALAYLPASSASVLSYTYPIHVAWMGRVFLGERVRPVELGLLAAVMAGAVLVAGQTPTAAPGLGLVMLVVATLTSAIYMVSARRIVRDVQPITAMAILGPVSAIVYWAAALAAGQVTMAMPAAALAAVLGAALLANLIAPILMLSGLRAMPAVRASMLGTLEPVVTVTLSILFLGDVMTPLRALGIAIVIGAITILHARRSA